MNDTSLSRALALALVAALAVPSVAHAEKLDARAVVREAAAKNPSLGAVMQDLAAREATVESESARYDPTLTVNLYGVHSENPSLTNAGSVLVGSNDTVATDATLSKKLSWGTSVYATLGAQYSRSASPIFLGSAQSAQPLVLTLGPGYSFNAKAGITQPLLRGAGSAVTLAAYDQAVTQKTAAERERDGRASALVRDVLVAYWELWYASSALVVDRTARDTARAQRDDAVARMDTGSLARADVLTFETQLATKEEAVLQTELERRTRANEVARLLGRTSGADGIEVGEAEPPAPGNVPGDLVARALEGSPDVATKKAAVEVAAVQERTAADAFRPRLDLDAYVQAQGLGNDDVGAGLSQLFGFGVLSARVGLTLELPLTGTRQRAEASRAKASTTSARHALEATRQSVRSDVVVTAEKCDLARRRIELAKESVAYAEQQLAAEKGRFQSGSGTALQVIQAQDATQAAARRLARARADLVQAHLGLEHLVGDLLPAAGRVAELSPRRTSKWATAGAIGHF